MYQNLDELLEALKGKAEITKEGKVAVLDGDRFCESILDELTCAAVFSEEEVKEAARFIIREAAYDLGLYPSSIQELYEAKGKGEMPETTVPAINVRGLTYDVCRAVVRSAKKNNSGTFIFELARSEMGYTEQPPDEYATVVIAACLREGYRGPVFIQGDHFQVKKDTQEEIKNVKLFIKKSLRAGFYNIDLDTSTLVDLSKPTVYEQQRRNFEVAAELTSFVREIEPEGVTVSLGGEIGEIGGKNSTEEELRAYLKGLKDELNKVSLNIKGVSKIAIQTGTTHGGVPLPDGSIAEANLDFETLEKLSNIVIKDYGLAGCVQHGASTLPSEAFYHFPRTRTAEVHLATEYQNMIYDHPIFPENLKEEVYGHLKKAHANEWKEGQSEEQFIYKTRKKGFGPFKKKFWDLPEEVREKICQDLEETFDFLFKELGAANTYAATKEKISRVYVQRPMPEALKARIS